MVCEHSTLIETLLRFVTLHVTFKVSCVHALVDILLTRPQGYYVKPLDGSHFVKLFADAQFYSCKVWLILWQLLHADRIGSATPHRPVVRV